MSAFTLFANYVHVHYTGLSQHRLCRCDTNADLGFVLVTSIGAPNYFYSPLDNPALLQRPDPDAACDD